MNGVMYFKGEFNHTGQETDPGDNNPKHIDNITKEGPAVLNPRFSIYPRIHILYCVSYIRSQGPWTG